MLRLAFLIALSTSIALCQLGGWKDIPVSSLPKSISHVGIMSLCKESNFDLASFSTIEDVKQQLVAGTLYKFTIVFNFDNKLHKFQVKVWKKLDGQITYSGATELTPHEAISLIGIPGGWNEISPEDVPEEIKQFGFQQISARINHLQMNLNSIESAKSQIVAGINYDFVLVMKGMNCIHKFRVIVFKGLDSKKELVSMDEIYHETINEKK